MAMTGTPVVGSGISMRALLWATAAGVLLPALVAVLAALGHDRTAWTDGVRWVLYMGAAGVLSAIVGLIFGVPRSRTEFTAEASERYSSNSNLEEISDWLTKLLVGATLVQLGRLPSSLGDLGSYLGAGMKVPNGEAFSVVAVLYGAGVGFAGGYLWTRLRLRYLLERSDRDAAAASRAVIELAIRDSGFGGTPESEETAKATAARVVNAWRTRGQRSPRILWVDDRPTGNAPLIRAFQSLGIDVDLALDTDQAMGLIANYRYHLIISDLGRLESDGFAPMAGMELANRVRAERNATPIFIYSTSNALARESELRAVGVDFVTTRGSQLLERAVDELVL